MAKTVYQTNSAGLYIGEIAADESPLDPGAWLVPAGCVEVAPPVVAAAEAARWDGAAWRIVPDHRGETWYDAGGAPVVVTAVGDPVEEGLSREAPPLLPTDLPTLKAALCAQIDAAAEAERGRYITSGSGQAMTYQTKAAEALALAADPAPDPAAYPLLSAEVGITAPDLTGVGAVVRGAYAAWQVIGAAIERARLAGKVAVMAAEDEAAARAAAGVEWPAPPA